METRLAAYIEIIKKSVKEFRFLAFRGVPWKLRDIQIGEGKNNFPYPYLHVKQEFRGEKYINASMRARGRSVGLESPGKDNED